jgi:hypothetical protein
MGKRLVIKGADFSENGIGQQLLVESSFVGVDTNWTFTPGLDLDSYTAFRIVCESTNATNHRTTGAQNTSWFSINGRATPDATTGGVDYYKIEQRQTWSNIDRIFTKQERYVILSGFFGSDESISYKIYGLY